MGQMVLVQCPRCNANLQIDPEIEVASCSECNTSSFVQTAKRRASREFLQQGGRVIDVTMQSSLPWLIALVAGFAVCALASVVFWMNAREVLVVTPSALPSPPVPSAVVPPAPTPSPAVSSPAVPSQELSPLETEPSPTRPTSVTPVKRSTPRKAARVTAGAITVSGRLGHDVIQSVVRQNFGRIRLCYEQGLGRNPALQGTLSVRFVIGRDGSVSNANLSEVNLRDDGVSSCTRQSFMGLSFPAPAGGIVTVIYPLKFSLLGG